MTVQPWEPVKGWWMHPGDPVPRDGGWDITERYPACRPMRRGGPPLHVTLANGQKIIVRAKR